MDWKDTVMDAKGITEAINRVYPSGTGTYQVNVADRAIAKAQAEITGKIMYDDGFKAGYDEGVKEGLGVDMAALELAKRAGRREVVEAVHQLCPLLQTGQDIQTVAGNSCKGGDTSYLMLRLLDWQAQLKEWGIE
ncbi:MAG TPA: hypothetical protein VMW45_03685 [Dehalococcoidia bacterium]|nr:hypothetical protein [Dehalococcoidia bacterium]